MKLNKIIEMAALGVGGISLFLVSFLVFALAAGVPAHKVALIGGMFPEPENAPTTAETELGEDGEPTRVQVQDKSIDDVLAATLGRLPAYTHTSPFQGDELETLVADLKRRKLEFENGQRDIQEREDAIEERDIALDEKARLLQDLMAQLDLREGELKLKTQELARDEAVADEAETQRWKTMAQAFADKNAVKKLAPRLKAYGPEDGARILQHLDPKQRQALLMELADEDFRAFNDAFSALGS